MSDSPDSTLGAPILIVDDDAHMRAALSEAIHAIGYRTQVRGSAEDALVALGNQAVAAVITDVRLPGMHGLELFRHIAASHPSLPVLVISGFGTVESAVDAMRSGAVDFLTKPFSHETLRAAIQRALGAPPAPDGKAPRDILTRDPELLKTLKLARIVAASQATILIEGESGTGKELLARYIWEHSPRAHRPFVAVNCAAMPEGLLESELFGYEKGAFTGAVAKKPGRFELAHTGTILLDEVSELHLGLQAKLLRVLQERELDTLGGRKPLALDIRVVATTNRPLWEEVQAGRFREDLYYRLNVFPLRLPPLRRRPADIPLLAEHFVRVGSVRNRKSVLSIAPDAVAMLMSHEWRGNVRELENAVERAVLLAEHGVVTREHLHLDHADNPTPRRAAATHVTVWEAERQLIIETLERVGGNRTHAARLLGISIRTLRNKLRAYRETASLYESGSASRGDAAVGNLAS